ncbi:hypothetical protein AMS68_002019 [Peltaster fructicola]|uniref:Uncharacterized protein n=1 Tax=Peltaster fructicola TaxID=286661 RepID=A0A6H0XP15_9PEZI|nr:hypothetical protein AMS68_002019 [Peltaster fructicola]
MFRYRCTQVTRSVSEHAVEDLALRHRSAQGVKSQAILSREFEGQFNGHGQVRALVNTFSQCRNSMRTLPITIPVGAVLH